LEYQAFCDRNNGPFMASPIERKLTTIFSADVVGYARLMGQDESGTLATLRTYREVMAGLIAGRRGRVVNTAGDSLLAEFPSVVLAVECAVQVQREVAERNVALPEDRRMWFRIGINLGDVMVHESDLHGDSVNVAARLQALADPGGILISGPVFDQVRNKLALGFDYLGPASVKNIAAYVPIYRVLLKPDAIAPSETASATPTVDKLAREPGTRRHRLYVSAATAGTFIALLFAINMFSWDGELWFHWPTLTILFVFCLRVIRLYRA
jgi:adenylate cyclase